MKRFLLFTFFISTLCFAVSDSKISDVRNSQGGSGGSGGTPAGNDTELQFNDSGSFGASSKLFYGANGLGLTDRLSFDFEYDTDIFIGFKIDDNLIGYGIAGSVNYLQDLNTMDFVMGGAFDLSAMGGPKLAGGFYLIDGEGGQSAVVVQKQRASINASNGDTWNSSLDLQGLTTLTIQGEDNYFNINTDDGSFIFQNTSLTLPANTVDSPSLHFTEGFNLNSPQKGDMWWNGTELIFNNGAQNIDLLSGGGGDKDYIWSNIFTFSEFLTDSGLRSKLTNNSELVNVYLYDAMSTSRWQLNEGFPYSDRIRLVGISTKASKSVVNILGSGGGAVGTGTFFQQIENIMFVNQQSSAIPFSISDPVHIKAKNVYFKSDNDTDDAQPFFYLAGTEDFSITGDFTFLTGDAPVLGIIGGFTGTLELKVGDGEIQEDTIYGGNGSIPNGVTGSKANYTYGKIALDYKFTPTSGTFDLTWNGETVSGLAFDISEGDLQTAIRTITGLADVTVTKTGDDFLVDMVNVDVPLLTGFTVTDNTNGVLNSFVNGSGNWQEAILRSQPAVTCGTYDITLPGNTATLNWNDDTSAIQNALRALSGLPNLTVIGTMNDPNGIIVTSVGYVGDLAWGVDLSNATATPSQLTLSAYTPNAVISLDQPDYIGNINKDELGFAHNLKYNAYKMSTAIDDAYVANTTDETTMIGASIGDIDILANTLKAGDVIRLKATGLINTTGTPDGTIRIYLGSTVVATSTVTLTSLTDNYFEAEIDLTVRTITTITETGSIYASGKTVVQSPSGFGNLVGRAIYTATDIEVDTSVDNILNATYQFSVADPENNITVRSFIVERL